MSSSNATLPSACGCNLTITPHIYNNNAAAAVFSVPIAIFAIVSNGVVILTVARTRSLQRPANIVLCSLALSDLLVGAVVQPAMIASLLFHNAAVDCCLYHKVNGFFHGVASFFTLNSFVQICVMSWDRYKAVSSPMIYRSTVTNKKTIIITAMAWLAWLALFNLIRSVPRIFSRPIGVSAMVSYVLIIGVSQAATLRSMRRHQTQIADTGAPAERNSFSRERKMAITLRWILAVTILSICPQIFFSVSVAINDGSRSLGHTLLAPWVRLILCLNSSLSPIIYFWRHDTMRSAALKFF